MNLYDSNIWINDIDEVISHLPELSKLAKQSILITGAAGLICSAVTDIIIRYNETHKENIIIYAAGRNEKRMKYRFATYFERPYFNYVSYDSSRSDNCFDFCCDYIIHGAANSSPKRIVKEPVETMLGNFIGIKCLLDYAIKKKTKRILYISSSEVYGKNERKEPAHEDDYGFIDILNSRNSYSISKQAAETLCVSYAQEYGVDSVIIRPGHIYGPTASRTDDHVSSEWTYNAVDGKDIIMKSNGEQIRSYVYCLDCASAILKVLLFGKTGNAYNVSTPNSIISIKEMADFLCKAGNVKLHVDTPNLEEKKGFNPMSNSSLDSTQLMELGWRGYFDACTGFGHTVAILKEILF